MRNIEIQLFVKYIFTRLENFDFSDIGFNVLFYLSFKFFI